MVEGRLSVRSYESKTGEKHKAAEVVISLMQMLGRASAAAATIGRRIQKKTFKRHFKM